ncbi:predicted protein [Nematostella vectensis]|uniref:Helitron helicase-like domain-containing protein n=1 Tax=Nematostella vectensis TaxID=45351 RepID=A7SXG3_NEMVE|nr:predicted protein [Nematostella vectensis]|eukprot:XP_001623703.1 predicted protein [Nematostella vectensis]
MATAKKWFLLEKKEKLDDLASKFRCIFAYHYLMNSTESTYKHFVELRATYLTENRQLNIPFEWTFPWAQWLRQSRDLSGKGPTGLAILETLNIIHILEQTVRGYLCGSNTNRWTDNVFTYNHIRNRCNVENFFYRIEFRGRGTAHVHLLVCLESLKQADYRLIRGDIPWLDAETAYVVNDLQPSQKDAFPECNERTSVKTDQNGEEMLSLYHPNDAFSQNLRAYISTILPFLKCKMDVQVSDKKSMVLRYVTSYISKFHDQQTSESLYSRYVTPAMAGFRHVSDLKPLEPEMVVTLPSFKPAWTNNPTKRYVPPRPSNVDESVLVTKYINRGQDIQDYSLLQWLRTHDTNKSVPTPYKRQTALVGVKYVSVFNPCFFFQYLLLNVPFKNISELRHPYHDTIPEQFKYYAAALALQPELWNDDVAIANLFRKQGNKEYYVDNVLSFLHSTRQMYHLWQQRCVDDQYKNILDHLRYWKPTPQILSTLNHRVIYRHKNVLDVDIKEALKMHPQSIVVTVSKRATARVNKIVFENFFLLSQSLGTMQLDNNDPPMHISKNMRVIITQNLDKSRGVVNGQTAIVHFRSQNKYNPCYRTRQSRQQCYF